MEKVQTYKHENALPLNVGKLGLEANIEVSMVVL
jgi:hypothetical protein